MTTKTKQNAKAFPVSVVLTITTGRLLTDISDIYEILGYMTGEKPFTHQLPRFSKECEPVLMEAYPELKKAEKHLHSLDKGVELTKYTNGDVKEYIVKWVNMCIKDCRLKAEYAVPKLAVEGHIRINPILELDSMIN